MKFIRADAHKKKRISSGWRKPKGLQNKMRLQLKGYRKIVKPGYGTDNRDTNKGLAIVLVNNEAELSALDPKKQTATLGSVGRKKKETLIELAKKKGITITNFSVAKYQEKTKHILEEKKKKKEELKEKEKKKAEKQKEEKKEEKPAEKPEEKTEEKTDEEKKKAEKKEKDKLLTSTKEQY